MKVLSSFFIMSFLALWIYRVDARVPVMITVDLNDIIFKTAQSFAKQNLSENQLQRRLIHFKKGLEASLKEFGEKKGAIVLPKYAVYGHLKDETIAFIAYHNGDENVSS